MQKEEPTWLKNKRAYDRKYRQEHKEQDKAHRYSYSFVLNTENDKAIIAVFKMIPNKAEFLRWAAMEYARQNHILY